MPLSAVMIKNFLSGFKPFFSTSLSTKSTVKPRLALPFNT